MATGTVKFFNEEKGYGFIAPDDGGKDLFVHASGTQAGTLRKDEKVTFDIGEGRRGPMAVNVK